MDEVQNLSLAALEELRMLSNITEDGRASLQTILLGQPQFRRMLASPDLDQLRQRVLASYHLGPLTARGDPRLHRAPADTVGWHGNPHWDEAAFAAVHAIPAAFRGGSTGCARGCCCSARWRRPTRSPRAMVDDTAEELAQDLEGGRPTAIAQAGAVDGHAAAPGLVPGAMEGGLARAGLLTQELARLSTDLHAELHAELDRESTAVAELRQRLDALEQRMARHDRVFQQLLDALGARRRRLAMSRPVNARLVNALTVDVEDYFQVQAFADVMPRATWDDDAAAGGSQHRTAAGAVRPRRRARAPSSPWAGSPSAIPRWCAASSPPGTSWPATATTHQRVDRQTPDDVPRRRRPRQRRAGGCRRRRGRRLSRRRPFRSAPRTPWAFACPRRGRATATARSVYPVQHDLYGMPDAPRVPFQPACRHALWEFPMTTLRVFGRNCPARAAAVSACCRIRCSALALRRCNQAQGSAGVFYFHPVGDRSRPAARRRRRAGCRGSATTPTWPPPRLERLLADFAWDRMDRVFAAAGAGMDASRGIGLHFAAAAGNSVPPPPSRTPAIAEQTPRPIRTGSPLSRKRFWSPAAPASSARICASGCSPSGHDVLCVDNYFTGRKDNIAHLLGNPHFEVMRHDVTFPLYVEVDEIYNLACPASPIHYQFDPVQTTKTSVHRRHQHAGPGQAACGAKILQASTTEVYGDPTVHPQTEDYRGNVNPIGPRACYDEGKRCAETLFFDYHRQHRLRIKVVRIFNTYGPRMHPERRPRGLQLHRPGAAGRGHHALRRRQPDPRVLLRRRPDRGLDPHDGHRPTTSPARSTSATRTRSTVRELAETRDRA